jgi:hypothetical protein
VDDTTNDSFAGLADLNLDHLGRLLSVLREHGVTRAKFGSLEFDVQVKPDENPLTFADIDRANEGQLPPSRTFRDVKFPGKVG